MPNAFIRKLECYRPLEEADRDLLADICRDAQTIPHHTDIISEGANPDSVHIILEGWGYRYKILENGQRQIFAYLVAGDLCDLHVAILGTMDHSIAAMSECSLVEVSHDAFFRLTDERPAIRRALWWSTLVDSATLREWVINLGQRDADARIAHLFYELYLRVKAVGMNTDGSFELPITQEELADTMGLSNVHANRSLKVLRDRGLVTFRGQNVVIPDVDKLARYSDFDPTYLHIENVRRSSS